MHYWPQVVVLMSMGMHIGFDVARHGDAADYEHNLFVTAARVIVSGIVLYYGGFFTAWGWMP